MTTQLRWLKWISAIVSIGGVVAVLMYLHHSLAASVLIAVPFAIPPWTLLHLAEKGVLRRSSRPSGKGLFFTGVFGFIVIPPMIMVDVMNRDFVLAALYFVMLCCNAYFVVRGAKLMRASEDAGKMDTALQ